MLTLLLVCFSSRCRVSHHDVHQLCQAAIGLNRVGVAHNDITPDNIMLEPEQSGATVSYRATLIDLGTATILSVSQWVPLALVLSYADEVTTAPAVEHLMERTYASSRIFWRRGSIRGRQSLTALFSRNFLSRRCIYSRAA